MLHPSYTELMDAVNSEVKEGEQPIVSSRYSIVIAAAKRARQIIAGAESAVPDYKTKALPLQLKNLWTEMLRSFQAARMRMMKTISQALAVMFMILPLTSMMKTFFEDEMKEDSDEDSEDEDDEVKRIRV